MHVGFDATTIRGRMSGVGHYTARLLERLTRVGGEANPIDHLVVLSNHPVEIASDLPRTTTFDSARFSIRAVWMQSVLPFLLKRLQPDVCHFTNFLAPLVSGGRYVVTVHDMSLQLMPSYHTLRKRLMTAGLMPTVVRNARLVITPSESAKEDTARILGIDPQRIRVIPHAADDQFKPQSAARWADIAHRTAVSPPGVGVGPHARNTMKLEKPYLLSVGTLEPRKNIARTVAAFARIAHRFPDHHFYLVGELGWKYGEVLQALERHHLGGRVKRLGYVPEEDLPTLYSHADLVVYPSLYEGFGFPVVEAMACGAPVLTSDGSSLREVGEGAALLVDPENVDAIVDAMERGLTHGSDRDLLIQRGFRKAASYSWEKTTLDTIAVYEEAAERAAVKRPRAVTPVTPAPGELSTAIARTVAYGAIFDYPMKVEEIFRSLSGVEATLAQIETALATDPWLKVRVENRGAYYFLRGRGKSVPRRWNRERLTRELLARHRRALDLVGRVPFVRMVALSGATAHGNAADNDIDLFVVTAPERTWAVSLLLYLGAKLAGLRHVLCVNYMIGESVMALGDRDPFTAHQLVSLRPLAGSDTYLDFMAENSWVGDHYPNFYGRRRDYQAADGECPPAGSPWIEAALAPGGGFVLERIGRLVHRTYLRFRARRAGKPAAVKLEDSCIKLHFKDHGVPLNARLQEILGELDASLPVAARN